jgi:hypothetical protein
MPWRHLVGKIILMGYFGHKIPQRGFCEWHHDKLYYTTIMMGVTNKTIGIVILK